MRGSLARLGAPPLAAVAAIALAAALGGMPLLGALAPAAHAQQYDNGDCLPDPSDCIFRFTDTPVLERPENAPSGAATLIKFDPVRDRLYVAYKNVVTVYDASRPGYPAILDRAFPGTGTPIEDMAVNTKTGDLYVATYTGGTARLSAMNSTGSLSEVNLLARHFGTGERHPVRPPFELHVDSERSLVYVSTSTRNLAVDASQVTDPVNSGDGILVVNATAGLNHLEFGWSNPATWRNTYEAWFVSAMAVNSTAHSETIVYAMAVYWKQSINNWAAGLNTLRFAGGVGGVAFDPEYRAIDRVDLSTRSAGARSDPNVNAHGMVLDDRNDKLFVVFQNGNLAWYNLTARTSGAAGLPTLIGNLEKTAGSYMDLVLDEGRGLLYWITSTNVGVYRTSDGERLAIVDRPGQTGQNAAIDAVPASAALPAGATAGDFDTGIVYALGQAGPQLTVMDPRPESVPERLARDVADGGVVEIPDGTYRDVYLSTDAGGAKKAMTIRPESGEAGGVVFTGASHVRVRNGDVAVQGIVFRDTTCHDKLDGANSAGGYLPEHVVSVDVNTTHAGNITISGNTFENTCHGGIVSGSLNSSGSASGVAIASNTFRDIGYNARHYDGVPDRPRSAIETGTNQSAVQMIDSSISSNTFERVAGIAVDVRQARNLAVSNNTFADIPLSAVRIHGGSDGVAVRNNTITNASYAPSHDFLRGIEDSANLTQDAAILVVPSDGGLLGRTNSVSATGNTISRSGGAFSVCGAVCAGNASSGYANATGSDTDSIVGPDNQDVRFNANTVHMDNGGRLVENGVRGALDARYNYYPGYEPAASQFKANASASGQLPAGSVLYMPLLALPPDVPPSVLRVASANESGSYAAGDSIDIAVVFTKPIAVPAGAAPTLTIDVGVEDRAIAMQSHNETAIFFRYAIAAGDSSPALEYAGEDSLANGGSGGGITGLYTGAPASLSLPERGSPESLSASGIAVGASDTTAPAVLNVTSGSADGAYGTGRLVEVQVAFSEAVRVRTDGGTPTILLDTGANAGAGSPAAYAGGSGTDTLVFEYHVAPGDASGDLDYVDRDSLRRNGGTITDGATAANLTLPEPGGPRSLGHSSDIIIDTEAPRVLSVSSPGAGSAYGAGSSVDIAVSFSKAVSVTGTPMLALSTDPARSAAYVEESDGDAELAFLYEVQAGDFAGRLDYASRSALSLGGGTIMDAAGNNASLDLPPTGSSPLYASNITIGSRHPDGSGGSGTPDGGSGGTGNTTTVVIGPDGIADGQGSLAGSGNATRVTIDMSGLPGAGIAGGTVRLPQAGAVVTTSFASVSFPPGANATSVPADGLLVLHVVAADDGDLPSNSSIQRDLAYDGSGAVALQRVVEVGDEDGRIAFSKPVRISLEGQAGGRAFYISSGAGGTATPIDDACAADDAERVHRHLDGTGECRIDSADGEDMVIYTYHLTRFGTVMPENDVRPPAYYTCSVDLESAHLRLEAEPGRSSEPVPQGLINSGSAPFERVGLEATRWQAAGSDGASLSTPAPSLPAPVSGGGNGTASSALVARIDASLPAAASEVSEAGEGGSYAAVSNGTAVAGGLGGGDVKQLWFKLNLTPYDAVQGSTITQTITYSAQCIEP